VSESDLPTRPTPAAVAAPRRERDSLQCQPSRRLPESGDLGDQLSGCRSALLRGEAGVSELLLARRQPEIDGVVVV
jgi:hypothetical protein